MDIQHSKENTLLQHHVHLLQALHHYINLGAQKTNKYPKAFVNIQKKLNMFLTPPAVGTSLVQLFQDHKSNTKQFLDNTIAMLKNYYVDSMILSFGQIHKNCTLQDCHRLARLASNRCSSQLGKKLKYSTIYKFHYMVLHEKPIQDFHEFLSNVAVMETECTGSNNTFTIQSKGKANQLLKPSGTSTQTHTRQHTHTSHNKDKASQLLKSSGTSTQTHTRQHTHTSQNKDKTSQLLKSTLC